MTDLWTGHPEADAVDASRDRHRQLAVVARRQAHLLRDARHHRSRRARAQRQAVHRRSRATRRRRSRASGRSISTSRQERRLTSDPSYSVGDVHHLARRQVDRLSRHVGEPLRARHSRAERLRRSVSARRRERQDRAPDQEHRHRRRAGELLAGQQTRSRSRRRTISSSCTTSASTSGTSTSPARRWKKLGGNVDFDVRVGGRGGGGGGGEGIESSFWSANGDTIYFSTGFHATTQLFAPRRRERRGEAAHRRQRHDRRSRATRRPADSSSPTPIRRRRRPTYTVASLRDVNDRSKWTQLTDPNAWVKRDVALGDEEEITWKSTDGTMVSGVLVKPVGYQAGKRYPLIVAIHGGPAAADMLSFNGGYNAQVYAGAGYMVLQPNYRQSTQLRREVQDRKPGRLLHEGLSRTS